MSRCSLRFCLLVASVGSLFAAGRAHAQLLGTAGTVGTGGTTGTTSFTTSDFFVGVQHQAGSNLTDFEVARFFNTANCNCNADVFLYVALTSTGAAKRGTITGTGGTIEFWIGQTGCDQNQIGTLRTQTCQLLKSESFPAFLNEGFDSIPTNARVVSTYTAYGSQVDDAGQPIGTTTFPPGGNPTCTLPVASFNQTFWVLVDVNGDGQYDVDSQTQVTVDLTPPPAPDPGSITVQGGNEALIVNWPSVNTTTNPVTDLLGYQVLCNRAGSLQVFNNNTFGAGYQICEPNGMGGGTVESLDPLFTCSPLLAATATGYRVKILQNGITYGVAVVSVDNSGNASEPSVIYGTPIKTDSFYDVYRQGGIGQEGQATGGFCAVSPAPVAPRRHLWLGLGAASTVALALAFVRRRRRR
jgi:hypothetical protein